MFLVLVFYYFLPGEGFAERAVGVSERSAACGGYSDSSAGQRSVIDAGVRAKESTGHRNRMPAPTGPLRGSDRGGPYTALYRAIGQMPVRRPMGSEPAKFSMPPMNQSPSSLTMGREALSDC